MGWLGKAVKWVGKTVGGIIGIGGGQKVEGLDQLAQMQANTNAQLQAFMAASTQNQATQSPPGDMLGGMDNTTKMMLFGGAGLLIVVLLLKK